MMRLFITSLMIFIGTIACAQNSKLEAIYNQIPPPPDKLICENTKSYLDEIDLLSSLMTQLEEMKFELNEKLEIQRNRTQQMLSAATPSMEELQRVEKLSEAEQRAFWKKLEDEQTQLEKSIASRKLKYQSEKEMLSQKVADYNTKSPQNIQEYLELYHRAGVLKSDKGHKIENDPSIKNRKQQMEAISIEYCTAVSPTLLRNIRYEFDNLKQNMEVHRRLAVIDMAEYSSLTEEELIKQNAAMLDLTDLQILLQFLIDYSALYDILPGQRDNQIYE